MEHRFDTALECIPSFSQKCFAYMQRNSMSLREPFTWIMHISSPDKHGCLDGACVHAIYKFDGPDIALTPIKSVARPLFLFFCLRSMISSHRLPVPSFLVVSTLTNKIGLSKYTRLQVKGTSQCVEERPRMGVLPVAIQ